MLNLLTNIIRRITPPWIVERLMGTMDLDGFKKYFRNTGWMFFGRIILVAINFFVAVYLARYLQPTSFGTYNYIISFVGLFSFIAGLGIDAILGREIILHIEKRAKLFGSALYIYSASAVLALLIVNVSANFITDDLYVQFLIFIFSLTFLFQGSGIFNVFFQSIVKAKQNTQIQIAAAIISAILKIVGITTGQGLMWFIGLFIIDALIYASLSYIVFKNLGGRIDFTPDLKLIYGLLKNAFPFMLSIVATSIYMKIDQVMITHMLGAEQTGIYSVAVRLSEAWYFIPSIICASLFPAIINAKKTDTSIYYSRISSLLILLFVIAILLAIPLYIFTPYIITYLYGASYIGAILPFQIYIWSSLWVFAMPALGAYMTAENRGRTLLFSTVLGAIVNIILNLILIPKYGIIGSAVATFISYTIPAIYLYIVFKAAKNQK